MEPCNISFNDKPLDVRLKDLSKKLGIQQNVIVEILKEAGFEVFNRANFLLNEKHLEILSQKYIESVKHLQKRLIKKNFVADLNYKANIRKFILKFVDQQDFPENVLSDNSISKLKLNTDLIRAFFFNLINEIFLQAKLSALYSNINDEYKNIRKFLSRIKIKVKSYFNHINSKILFTTVTGQYYIFTDEEDVIVEKKIAKDFSTIKNLTREALNKTHHLMLNNNGKYKSINRKFKKLQFI